MKSGLSPPKVGEIRRCFGSRALSLWDTSSGRRLHLLEGHTSSITNMVFSPDGQPITTVGLSTVRMWDAASASELLVLNALAYDVSNLDFSPDGQTLATVTDIFLVQLWSLGRVADLDARIRNTGARTNYSVCKDRSHEVVPVVPFPDPHIIWETEEYCAWPRALGWQR